MRVRSAALVRAKVRLSRYPPNMYRKVTAAASQTSPIQRAPTAAMVTSNGMLNCLARSLPMASFATGTPATTAATVMRTANGEPRAGQASKPVSGLMAP